MTDGQERVDHFIRLIRGISPQYLRYACTHGACHRFHLVLKDRFPEAIPYKTVADGGGHVVSRIRGMYWDIYGRHDEEEHGKVKRFTKVELLMMSSCQFDEGYVRENAWVIREYEKRIGSPKESERC